MYQCRCVSCAIVTLSDWLANTDSNRLRLDDRMWEPHTNCSICLCVVSFRCVCICMWIYLKDYPPISGYTGPAQCISFTFFHFPSLFVWMYLMLFGFHFVSFSFMTVSYYYYYIFFPFLLYFGDLLLLNEFSSSSFRVQYLYFGFGYVFIRQFINTYVDYIRQRRQRRRAEREKVSFHVRRVRIQNRKKASTKRLLTAIELNGSVQNSNIIFRCHRIH